MDRLLKNDLAVKILSVLLAVVLWYQVTGQGLGANVTRTFTGIAISRSDQPTDLYVASVTPTGVSVTAHGSAQQIDHLTSGDFSAAVQLRGAQAGRQEYYVLVSGPPGVSVSTVDPQNVAVVLEQIIERSLSFQVHVAGKPASGYRAGDPILNPAVAYLRGPASALNQVVSLPLPIDITGATAPVQQQVSTRALDSKGQVVPGVQVLPAQVLVTVPVTRVLPTASIPVSVATTGKPASGYAAGTPVVSPAQVTITAPATVLDRITKIETQPVDVSGAKSTVTVQVPLVFPSGVVSASPSAVQVRVPIHKGRASGAHPPGTAGPPGTANPSGAASSSGTASPAGAG